jgi:hypothetical protein
MNIYQELWWRQAQSDHDVLLLLRCQGFNACHQLHYLQMITEKVSKAYFWGSGMPPPKSHAGFHLFLRSLGGVRSSERRQIADIFKFKRFADFQSWQRKILPLAYELEKLAPALSQDNTANPEYPWPHSAPQHAPVDFKFPIWVELTETSRGRHLLQFIDIAVNKFPQYA